MKMKDKKAEQLFRKQHHRAQLQAIKNRRPPPDFRIPKPTRLERQRILIVCEGLNTEPDYFRQFRMYFRLASAEIVEVGGAGETIRVVERAKMENEKHRFDQTWVVFDKDDFPPDHFDKAIHMARASGFGVAYSNQAFEYWLLLHFEDHQGGAMHRNQYAAKLNGFLKPLGAIFDGKSTKIISPAFFQILMGKDEKTGKKRLDLAIKRAEKGLEYHTDKTSSALAESSTTVFLLVRELLRFAV
jgi:hypothetical protein